MDGSDCLQPFFSPSLGFSSRLFLFFLSSRLFLFFLSSRLFLFFLSSRFFLFFLFFSWPSGTR